MKNEIHMTVKFSGVLAERLELRAKTLGATKASIMREALAKYFGVGENGTIG